MARIKVQPPSEVRFLIPLNYNNVYARLRSVLGNEASLFAEIQKKSREIIWYAPEGREYLPLTEATPDVFLDVKDVLQLQLNKVKTALRRDPDLEKFAEAIVSYPSDDDVFYVSTADGSYEPLLAAWGCAKANDAALKKEDATDSTASHVDSKPAADKGVVQKGRKDVELLSAKAVAPKKDKTEKGGSKKTFIIVPLIALLCVVAAIGCFMLLNRDKTSKNEFVTVTSDEKTVAVDYALPDEQKYQDNDVLDSVVYIAGQNPPSPEPTPVHQFQQEQSSQPSSAVYDGLDFADISIPSTCPQSRAKAIIRLFSALERGHIEAISDRDLSSQQRHLIISIQHTYRRIPDGNKEHFKRELAGFVRRHFTLREIESRLASLAARYEDTPSVDPTIPCNSLEDDIKDKAI